uniref:Uncharacterized protein n=4 Tax=Aegilops tauschii subsp. strangulata TaxID=200361 RepID=A0A453JEF3_AEGTS
MPSSHLAPLALVHKQASSLLDGLLWKVAYIWMDSSWMLADNEDRWLLAREARMVHMLVLPKPLKFFMPARREGWLPTAPARSAHDSGGCALLMAASLGFLEPCGKEGTTLGHRVALATYRERGERRQHEGLRQLAAWYAVASMGR